MISWNLRSLRKSRFSYNRWDLFVVLFLIGIFCCLFAWGLWLHFSCVLNYLNVLILTVSYNIVSWWPNRYHSVCMQLQVAGYLKTFLGDNLFLEGEVTDRQWNLGSVMPQSYSQMQHCSRWISCLKVFSFICIHPSFLFFEQCWYLKIHLSVSKGRVVNDLLSTFPVTRVQI